MSGAPGGGIGIDVAATWHVRVRAALASFWGPAVAAAVLLVLSFPPLDQGWLIIPAWSLLLLSGRLRGGKNTGRQHFVAFLLFFTWSLAWIQPVMTPGWLVTALYCSGFEAAYGWALGRFLARAPRNRTRFWPLLAPPAHLLADLLRTVVFSGFPWFITGYAGWDNPVLLGGADLLGVHAATLAILAAAAGLAEMAARILDRTSHPARPLLPPAILWVALTVWAFGKAPAEVEPGPLVAVLQANIPQQTKEDREAAGGSSAASQEQYWRDWITTHEILEKGAIEAAADLEGSGGRRGLDLVIWPETMVPDRAVRPLDHRDNRPVWAYLAELAGGRPTLAGLVTMRPGERPDRYNTMVLLDGEGEVVGFQDKRHLTPGGEYIPLIGAVPFGDDLERWIEGWAGYVPDLRGGSEARSLALPVADGSVGMGVMICFEAVFPQVARSLERAGARFLVNSSNYGWFAGSAAMEQALAMNRFRAVELRRSLVSACNNGISCVIGPDGRLVEGPRAHLAADERGFMVARVPLASGSTVFAALGSLPAWLLGLAAAVAGFCLVRGPSENPRGGGEVREKS